MVTSCYQTNHFLERFLDGTTKKDHPIPVEHQDVGGLFYHLDCLPPTVYFSRKETQDGRVNPIH